MANKCPADHHQAGEAVTAARWAMENLALAAARAAIQGKPRAAS